MVALQCHIHPEINPSGRQGLEISPAIPQFRQVRSIEDHPQSETNPLQTHMDIGIQASSSWAAAHPLGKGAGTDFDANHQFLPYALVFLQGIPQGRQRSYRFFLLFLEPLRRKLSPTAGALVQSGVGDSVNVNRCIPRDLLSGNDTQGGFDI
jgi:hypothetical protein